MRNECNIIRDILPLYAENMVSEDSADFVKEHLIHCGECQAELNRLKAPLTVPVDTGKEPLRVIKKKMYRKRIQIILLTTVLALAAMTAFIAYLTAPNYIRYTDSLLSISENADGSVIVSFSDEVTGYQLIREKAPESGRAVYHIEAWSALWDKLFFQKGEQSVLIAPDDGLPITVYFTQNYSQDSHAMEDVLIYGESTVGKNGGAISLPGMSLGYWMIISTVLFVLGCTMWFICRKKRMREWVERISFLPLSYLVGHICVLGFHTVSYSEQRDLSVIVLIGLFAYCALLSGSDLYRLHKELKEVERK